MSFEDVLSPVLGIPGVLAAAFLDPDGEAVAIAGDKSMIGVLGAYQSIWLGELSKVSNGAQLGDLTEVSIEFAERKVIVVKVMEGYFLLILLSPGGAASIVRTWIPQLRRELAFEMS